MYFCWRARSRWPICPIPAFASTLAAFALGRIRSEATPTGLYYTPHEPVALTLAALFAARLTYRLVEVYAIDTAAPRSFGEFAHSPLALGAFAPDGRLVLRYMPGLVRWRRRMLRAKRARSS